MTVCYLALGSNLNRPSRQLYLAISKIKQIPQTTILKIAPLYTNPAVGLKNQPRFENTVVKIKTRLSPLSLLGKCQQIEGKLGRVRRRKWGARTIDIDIIFYGNTKINHPRLKTPHPLYAQRDFVTVPLSFIQQNHID